MANTSDGETLRTCHVCPEHFVCIFSICHVSVDRYIIFGKWRIFFKFKKGEQSRGLVVATNSGRPSLDQDLVYKSAGWWYICECTLILLCTYRMCGKTI